jgi:hypothetical protein
MQNIRCRLKDKERVKQSNEIKKEIHYKHEQYMATHANILLSKQTKQEVKKERKKERKTEKRHFARLEIVKWNAQFSHGCTN